jgi:hypothetical protein
MKRLVRTGAGVLALVLAAACAGSGTLPSGGVPPATGSPLVPGGSVAEPPASGSPASGVSGSSEPERTLPPYTPAAVVERDTDGDGANDEFTFTLPAEQLAENLTLVRTVALAARGTDAKVTLNLRYENSGSVPIRLTHRVVIPKEFAESIDEVTMSIPFARIINPDIEGDLDLDIDPGGFVDVVVEAHKRIDDAQAGASPEAWKLQFFMGLVGCDQALVFAPGDAAAREELRGACILTLVRQAKGHVADDLLASACDGGAGGMQKVLPGTFNRATCMALAKGEPTACDEIMNDAEAVERDLCEGYLAQVQCLNGSMSDPDGCLFDRALAGGSLFACAGIEDATLKIVCNAGVTGNVEYCKRLGDDKERVTACTEFVLAGKSGPLTPADWLGGASGDAESTPAQPVEGVDTAWFPLDEQDAWCRTFSTAMSTAAPAPVWTLAKAKNRKDSYLDCFFKAEQPERTKNVVILVLPSDRDAIAHFQKCCQEYPPGASVPKPVPSVDVNVAWQGERMSTGSAYYFESYGEEARHGNARWGDEFRVTERYRNCLIGVLTHSSYDGEPGSSDPVSAEQDGQTLNALSQARRIIDDLLAP